MSAFSKLGRQDVSLDFKRSGDKVELADQCFRFARFVAQALYFVTSAGGADISTDLTCDPNFMLAAGHADG